MTSLQVRYIFIFFLEIKILKNRIAKINLNRKEKVPKGIFTNGLHIKKCVTNRRSLFDTFMMLYPNTSLQTHF